MIEALERPVFLVGFMGSGKSTVGQALAQRLGWTLVDTDRQIARREGRTVEEIFSSDGEPAFRELEWNELLALDGRRRLVVATGGGMFLGYRHRSRMKLQGRTVWLDVPLEECRRRVGQAAGRPLWLADDPAGFSEFFERRRAVYALCEVRVDGSGIDPDRIAERVLKRL